MSNDFSIDVRVQVPRRRYKTLRAQAQAQRTTVEQLLRALVIEVVPEAVEVPPMTPAERDAYITRRNGEGAIDSVIAAELGMGKTTVAYRRDRLGLPPRGIRKNQKNEEVAS